MHHPLNIHKDWTEEGWQELASFVQDRIGWQVVEVGAGDDAELPAHSRHDRPGGRLPLLQTAEVIRRAQMFVGIDSGPAHLANALRVPGVVLLGQFNTFRTYSPFTGFYASKSPLVKIIRHLTGAASSIPAGEVTEALCYIKDMQSTLPSAPARIGTPLLPDWQPVCSADGKRLLDSGLFDAGWFVLQHPAAFGAALHPVEQYLTDPALFDVSPGPYFDGEGYLRRTQAAMQARANPLLHFLLNDSQADGHLVAMRGEDDSRMLGIMKRPAPTPARAASPWRKGLAADADMPRTFAFYLPQFHPIPENDRAHGPGFTEWHNVVKAKPLFPGHYQPRIPGELGYYDLRAPDVLHQQVTLAQAHGISGFCFYYYYFAGKKILYRPIETFLNSDIDFPFMLLWANENWTRRWDGGDSDIIIAQSHSEADDLAFIRGLFDTFRDRRYVRIDGKPILLIYKAHLFPDIRRTTAVWRNEIEGAGFPGLYLVMVDDWTSEPANPRDNGFDASYAIPSNVVPEETFFIVTSELGLPEAFEGRIIDYAKFAQYHMARSERFYRRFDTVMLPWDNTPRYAGRAMVHINAAGDAYRIWLLHALLSAYRHKPASERIVFLHSWNEWCEGTYLEPDGRFGRFFLEETRAAIDLAHKALSGAIGNHPELALADLTRLTADLENGAEHVLAAARRERQYLWRDLLRQREELRHLQAERSRLQDDLDRVYGSKSWKLTSPLRRVVSRLRGT
ncbi:MAG: glycoside hydrolase family 99-like domain-containing protein [Acetobacteraceae bacterium]